MALTLHPHRIPPDTIVLHHSAHTTMGPAAVTADHIKRGYGACGYHFMIGRSGTVYPGRAIEYVGAGVKKQNTGKIHICFLGHYDLQELTPASRKAVTELVLSLQLKLPSLRTVRYHSDLAETACPGRNVRLSRINSELELLLTEAQTRMVPTVEMKLSKPKRLKAGTTDSQSAPQTTDRPQLSSSLPSPEPRPIPELHERSIEPHTPSPEGADTETEGPDTVLSRTLDT